VTDFVYVPEFTQDDSFALHVVGDSMQAEGAPGFREGDLLIFAGGTVRSRDFAFVAIEGQDATFRQVFFDASGQVRLQPINLNYAAQLLPRERIRALWRLVGHVSRL
jgi:SOS-response transcriptional repressor LexA